MTLIIVKVETELFGTLTQKFESMKELNNYKKNPYVTKCEIVEKYENLSYDEFNKLWRK